MGELGCFVSLDGMIAGGDRMLYASVVGTHAALRGGGPMALGRSFVVVRSSGV
jgi:hypothetical protein